MLNRHPNIGLCDETFYFFYVYQRRRAFGDLNQPQARRLLVDRYLATNRIRRLGLDHASLADTMNAEGTSYDRMFAALLRFYAHSQGRQRWGEKTPQHALVADTLVGWYPDATVIHLVRDPRDVVASLLRMPWGSRSVLLNARLWERCTTAAERCRDRPNYLLVRYEDLVQEPERELQRVCGAVHVTYSKRLLDSPAQASSDRWWFERALQPLTTQRRNSWQQQLATHQVALIERILAPTMRAFGYNPAAGHLSTARLADALRQAAVESIGARARTLPRLWYHWLRPTELAAEEAWIDRHSRNAPPD
jgi:hypothetical protein